MKEKIYITLVIICMISFIMGMGYMFGRASACMEQGFTTWTPFGGCYKSVIVFEDER